MSRFPEARILVVGDIMLDIDRVAEVTRICPEAPVPVLLNPKLNARLGGAAAVAAMCAALGARVSVAGVIGQDREGQQVQTLLKASRVHFLGVSTAKRPTTAKLRIFGTVKGQKQQLICRMDRETTSPLSPALAKSLARQIRSWNGTTHQVEKTLPQILISDYAKGVCLPSIIEAARHFNVPTLVDPPRTANWDQYSECQALVPNRLEAGTQSAAALRRRYDLQAVIVKLDAEGCRLSIKPQGVSKDSIQDLPAIPRTVQDVTGAGDQFLAILGCARAAGADWQTAARLANLGAGMQVERVGCSPVTRVELLQEYQQVNARGRTIQRSA